MPRLIVAIVAFIGLRLGTLFHMLVESILHHRKRSDTDG